MLSAEKIEASLHGSIAWSLSMTFYKYYNKLRQVHHSLALLLIGWRKRKRDDQTLSYADAFVSTGRLRDH